MIRNHKIRIKKHERPGWGSNLPLCLRSNRLATQKPPAKNFAAFDRRAYLLMPCVKIQRLVNLRASR